MAMPSMTRIFSSPEEHSNPRIEKESVARFFHERAQKLETVGPIRAVIYQDKHPDLAEKQDIAEKERLLPPAQAQWQTTDSGYRMRYWALDW